MLITLFLASVIYYIVILINNKKYRIREGFEDSDDENNHDENTKKRVKHLKSIIDKLEKGISLSDEDMKENNTITDYDFDDSKEIEDENYINKKKTINMTAHEAQKQTYKLIDTVQQLNNTIKTLEPTIKNGQTILEKLESFNGKIKNMK